MLYFDESRSYIIYIMHNTISLSQKHILVENMANGKQLEVKIDKIHVDIDEAGEDKKYILLPTNKDLLKEVKITIKKTNTMEALGLPMSPGDTIIIELNAKAVQSKLIQQKPEEPEE